MLSATKQKFTHNVRINKGLSISKCKMHTHIHTHARTHAHMHARTHAHIVQTDRGEGQSLLTEIFGEEKCFAFEGRE